MDLKEEHLLGDDISTHWYYRAKLAALAQTIADFPPAGILDVGAGSGFFSRALLARTRSPGATCVDPGYAADRDDLFAGKPLHFRRSVAASDAGLVLMMDVIEHVADDLSLIVEYVAKVASGTRFVITVPAFMWLWSGHDVFLEHHRRYTVAGAERVIRAAGLRIDRGHYFYGAILPLVAGVRAANRLTEGDAPPGSDMRVYGSLTNGLLYAISRAEVAVMHANRLGGTTVFVSAVKP